MAPVRIERIKLASAVIAVAIVAIAMVAVVAITVVSVITVTVIPIVAMIVMPIAVTVMFIPVGVLRTVVIYLVTIIVDHYYRGRSVRPINLVRIVHPVCMTG